MPPSSSKSKTSKPTIDNFFSPPRTTAITPAPSRNTKLSSRSPAKSTASKPKKVVKRKKVELIHVDTDDSDIEILEPKPKLPRLDASGVATPAPVADSKGKGKQKAVEQDEESVPAVQQEQPPVEQSPSGNLDIAMDDGAGASATTSRLKDSGPIAMEGVERDTPFADSSRSEAGEGSQWGDDEAVLLEDGPSEGPEGEQNPLFRAETPEEKGLLEDEWGEEPPMEVASEDDGEFEVPPVGEDEDDDVVVQGSSKDRDATSKDDPMCPVCSLVLSSLPESQRQAHVNICLDGPKSNGGGFFAPISSLFRSRAPAVDSAPIASSSKSKTSTDKKPAQSSSKPSTTDKAPRRPLSYLPTFGLPAGGSSLPNAFTALMTGHVENKQWKEAEIADKRKGRVPKGEAKPVPFYKWIEGMEITVDAFRYNKIEGCKGYFLSHAHSDHYQNLSSSWSHGPIYCSLTTANLIKLKLNVKDEYLKVLPMNKTVKVEGIDVTLIDANHCPGSVIFLFEGPHTDPKSAFSKNPKRIFRYLHCGDFRASPDHLTHPAMLGKRMDAVYLDTTYLDAKYCFPAQELVVSACAQLVRERVLDGDEEALGRTGGVEQVRQVGMMKGWLKEGKAKKEEEDAEAERLLLEMEMGEEVEGGQAVKKEEEKPDVKPRKKEKLLVLVGTYSIGKERIVKGIARALETKIYCDDKKLAILKAQDDPELHSLITRNPLEAQVHVCWLQEIKHDALADYLGKYSAGRMEGGFTKCIGLRPTGWTYRGEGKSFEKTPSIAKIIEREKTRKFSPAGMYPQRDSTSTCLAYGVPYSEHSSFYELTCFALSLDYGKIIPTVNVHTAASRDKMKEWMTRWMQEKKRRAGAKIPLMVPHRSSTYW